MKKHIIPLLFLSASIILAIALGLVVPATARKSFLRDDTTAVLRLNLGPADPTLDPALMSDRSHLLVVNQLFLSLVRSDEETGAPRPELATSWVMSSDATVFTFTLRSGLTWSDGNPLTAHDVRYGILRSLDPATQSPGASQLFLIQNAEEYNNGTITDPDLVGITVQDYTHLRFKLEQPAAYFPSILTSSAARPVPSWVIADHPDDWTEPQYIVTNGAYRLTDWTHDISMTLEKNPGYFDAGNVQIGRISFSMLDDETAWTMYLSGELDSAIVPPAQWNAAREDPILVPQLHAAPRGGTYFYGFNTAKPPYDNLLVRKAFSAAVNRQGVVDLVAGHPEAWMITTVQGLPEALTFTTPGIWGSVDGTAEGVGIPYDPAQARQWLAAAGYPDGIGLPPITLAFNEDPVHRDIAEYIRQNWIDNLNVTVNLSSSGSFSEYRELLCSDPPQVWRLVWIMDYYDAYDFLHDGVNIVPFNCGRVPFGDWTNPSYESLLSLAAQTGDLDDRASLYRQAEQILVETDVAMIPVFYLANGIATKPYLQRTYELGGYDVRIAEWYIAHHVFVPLTTKKP